MLEVAQVHVIRHKVLVDGRSQREVAREMGISRNTVRKYLSVSEPKRVESAPRPRPVLERVRDRIDALLADWQGRTTPKQRITGTRLHRELLDEGYEVGITTVREYLRELRRQKAEVFVPLVHRPGDSAQVDFFEVTVDEGEHRRKAWMFLMRLMHSGRDFAWIYDRCDQVSFLDGHRRAFAHFGGVPRRCVYDNLTAAVIRVTVPKRELTPRFQAMVSHYLFEPMFARPATGHDKGGVEARGCGVRLQHLTPIPQGPSLTAICEDLLARVDEDMQRRKDAQGRTVAERFVAERSQFLSLPEPFDPRRVVCVSVSRSACVRVEGAVYSVPSEWASLPATAHIGPAEVTIVQQGQEVLHPRQRFGHRSIRYRHYLGELSRKPNAVRQVIDEVLADLGAPYDELWSLLVHTHGAADGARVFARVLAAVVDHGEDRMATTIRQALARGRLDLPRLWLDRPQVVVENPVPASLADHRVASARVADFDRLLVGGAHE
jgi:transposase